MKFSVRKIYTILDSARKRKSLFLSKLQRPNCGHVQCILLIYTGLFVECKKLIIWKHSFKNIFFT